MTKEDLRNVTLTEHIDFNRDRGNQRVAYLTILRKRVVEVRLGY